MDLSLSPAQVDVQDLARRLFADASARDAEPLGHDPALWKRLATTGICGMGLPEAAGGGDAGLDLLVVVAEEVGRTLAPVPFIEHAVAGRLLARVAPDDRRLEAIAAGDLVCTLAVRPPVDGTARLVPAGAVAGLVLTFDADALRAAEGTPPPPAANLATIPLADRAGPGSLLASGADAGRAYEVALDEWRVLTAAALIGLAQGALDLTVDYVQQRHQFGRPIGSFQALQHGLADLVPSIDGGRLLVHEAAWSLQSGERSQRGATGAELAVMALLFAAETARLAADRSVQYHGGYGYAMEQDPQLFYRKARGMSLVIGPGELARLGDLTLGGH